MKHLKVRVVESFLSGNFMGRDLAAVLQVARQHVEELEARIAKGETEAPAERMLTVCVDGDERYAFKKALVAAGFNNCEDAVIVDRETFEKFRYVWGDGT